MVTEPETKTALGNHGKMEENYVERLKPLLILKNWGGGGGRDSNRAKILQIFFQTAM